LIVFPEGVFLDVEVILLSVVVGIVVGVLDVVGVEEVVRVVQVLWNSRILFVRVTILILTTLVSTLVCTFIPWRMRSIVTRCIVHVVPKV
jgi:hypothetical protein